VKIFKLISIHPATYSRSFLIEGDLSCSSLNQIIIDSVVEKLIRLHLA
jgi:hypothetical protein